MRALPSVLTPFVADQPSWARVVEALGVGPRTIPFRELTAERLAEAIRQAMTDGAMRERAARLGERIRSEDGLGRAVEVISDNIKRV